MTDILDFIKNDCIREIAKKSRIKKYGDFGMVIYGGIDLELFAKNLLDFYDKHCLKCPREFHSI